MQPAPAIRCRSEHGYILLTLLLFVAMLAIAAAAIAPTIAFQIKREREEEMIHRGVQYSRAIRRYVRKYGRFPTRIEDLENTNNVRYLRKRYKDPITGKDFKVLHFGDVQTVNGLGIPGATPVANMPGANRLGHGNMGGSPGNNNQDQSDAEANPGDAKTDEDKSTGETSSDADKLSGQVFGGGPIVGVASISKAETIREFNHKNHYDQWQFIYEPSSDRGSLINTPYQPSWQPTAPNLQR